MTMMMIIIINLYRFFSLLLSCYLLLLLDSNPIQCVDSFMSVVDALHVNEVWTEINDWSIWPNHLLKYPHAHVK